MLERSIPEKDHPYYDVRDQRTGRFTKLDLRKESPAMTIDNETQQEVHNVPVSLDLSQDENMIRSTLGKFADGIVSLSKFAKQIEDMEGKLNELTARLGEATDARDKAIADAATARHDAEMARQAYDTANAKRIEAERDANETHEEYRKLFTECDQIKCDLSLSRSEVSRLDGLLSIAREERDRFREAEGAAKVRIDDLELRVMKGDEAKVNLDIANKALDECAVQVAHWKARANDVQIAKEVLTKECDGLHYKVNGLEDERIMLIEQRDRLQATIADIRAKVQGEWPTPPTNW